MFVVVADSVWVPAYAGMTSRGKRPINAPRQNLRTATRTDYDEMLTVLVYRDMIAVPSPRGYGLWR